MFGKKKKCPICGQDHKYVGLKKRYLEGGFFFPDILIGLEVVYKCDNGHWWTKRWHYATPLEYKKWSDKNVQEKNN